MKKLKRSISLLLCIVMLASNMLYSFASEVEKKTEETQIEETQSENSEETLSETQAAFNTSEDSAENKSIDNENVDEADDLKVVDVTGGQTLGIDYVYLDYEIIYTDEMQVVAVHSPELTDAAVNVRLIYIQDGDEQELFAEAMAVSENTAVFTLENLSEGHYVIKGIQYELDGNMTILMLDDMAEEIWFTVLPVEQKAVIINDGSVTAEDVAEAIVGSQDVALELEESANTMMLKTASAPTTINVVLNAGHDSAVNGAGARGPNGLAEEDVNLALVLACKEELEKYAGVNVYLTRSDSSCPLGGSTCIIKDCLKKRVEIAASYNATIYISFHCNSLYGTWQAQANGALVYITSYTPYTAESEKLADKILDMLATLGLKDRGVLQKEYTYDDPAGTPKTYYDDGTEWDYYADVRHSVLSGFPGILIEHGFMDNSADNAMLSNSETVKLMGIADATAIAQYYGLTLKSEVDNREVCEEFVTRLYELALGRTPETAGLNAWADNLQSGIESAANIAYGVIFSDEYKNKETDNAAYVEMLYNVMFDREGDADGAAAWLNQLDHGVSRFCVFYGFVESVEFANLCNRYSLNKGTVTLTENRDQNSMVTMFIYRCYMDALGREPEVVGLNEWTGLLNSKQTTPILVARDFIFSQEFLDKDYSDSDYVKLLYRVFMDREYDEGGLEAWTNVLANGTSRENVFYGFANSQEYNNILKMYNLN